MPVRRIVAWSLLLATIAAPARALAADDPVTEDLRACAMLGPKRPGMQSTKAMSELLERRFEAAGLDTRVESFHLPVSDVRSVIAQQLSPTAKSVPATAFAYTGRGTVEAPVVYVGSGRAQDYQGVDATGKIVMVERDEIFHRSSQLNEVVAQGGAAMLYVSGSPENLVQIGAVRFAQHMPSPIPTVTVGADDGAPLTAAAQAGTLKMRLTVDAVRKDATGRNVIGVRKGTTYPDRYVVVGAHYDSWYDGAVDNCSATATLLQMADASRALNPAYTVIYAGWDAEEVGLTGSSDFVRRHPDVVTRTVVNQNLEMDAAAADGSSVNLAFGSLSPTLTAVIEAAGLSQGFLVAPAPATAVRAISGGIIPTDLQEFYARGVQGFSTYASTAYYHTTQDTPDKINPVGHVKVTAFSKRFLELLQAAPPEAFAAREVPTLDLDVPSSAKAGEDLKVTVKLTAPGGTPELNAPVQVTVQNHGWWPVTSVTAKAGAPGVYTATIPGSALKENGEHWIDAQSLPLAYAAKNAKAFAVVGGTAPVAPGDPDPATTPPPGVRVVSAKLQRGRRALKLTLSRSVSSPRVTIRTRRGGLLASRRSAARKVRTITVKRSRPFPRGRLTIRLTAAGGVKLRVVRIVR